MLCLLIGFSAAQAVPVIRPGREAEVEGLFSGLGEKLPGWAVPDIQIDRDRIIAKLAGPRATLTVELCAAGRGKGAFLEAGAFELRALAASDLQARQQEEILATLAQLVAHNSKSWRWDEEPGLEEGENRLILSAFLLCWLGLAFLLFVALLLLAKLRPFSSTSDTIALALILLSVICGLALRWWVVEPGPGQLVSRIPAGPVLPDGLPEFGPAHHAWVLLWYWMAGANDRTAFLSGAVMGTLAIAVTGALAWMMSGRVGGVTASWLLALWPVHARLSPTDDASVMVATLLCASAAFLKAAENSESRLALLAAWTSVLLASLARPEALLACGAVGAWVLFEKKLRKLHSKPLVLFAFFLLLSATIPLVFVSIRWAAAGPFDALSCAFGQGGWKLYDFVHGGSLLAPPRTPLFLTAIFFAGLGLSFLTFRQGALWLLLMGLLPALPLACMSGTDIVTARYQLSLLGPAAVLGAQTTVWLIRMTQSFFRQGLALGLYTLLLGMLFGLFWAKPYQEPTFRLEYFFFREHIVHIPAECSLVLVRWPTTDLGLRVPEHLPALLGLGHRWIEPAPDLDVENQCIVYWQPASCRAKNPDWKSSSDIHPECGLIENNYRLEPLYTTRLPARTGFCESYLEDPVPVGFYRLRARRFI